MRLWRAGLCCRGCDEIGIVIFVWLLVIFTGVIMMMLCLKFFKIERFSFTAFYFMFSTS